MNLTALKETHGATELLPTPTQDNLPRRFGDFPTLIDALEYAALGARGVNFYSARGDLLVSARYADLRARAEKIGRKLIAMGFAPGDRVALIAVTHVDFVAFFLGCQYATVLPVPLPLPTSFGGRDGYISQLHTQMESCRASAIIGPDAMDDFGKAASAGLGLKFCGSYEDFDALPVDLDGPFADSDGQPIRPMAGSLAYLQYSSGSTRFPHGIAITHKALMANCAGQGRDGVRLIDDDRCISWLPFYHDMGLVGTLLTPIANQVSVDFLATEDFARRPMQWLGLMSRNRGTITYSPSFGYDICARRVGNDQLKELDLSAWRVAGIGGDMIRPEVIRRFADIYGPAGFKPTTFVPSYGLAECTLAVSFAPIGRGMEVDLVDERVLSGEYDGSIKVARHFDATSDALKGAAGAALKHHEVQGTRYREIVNCGIPLPDYDIEIRDEDGAVLGEREIGRIYVRGASVMTEYFGDPDTTAAVLSESGWLDTGDMGYMGEGALYVIGRAKDMIIINGRNHWPQDIEWAVEQLSGVRSGDVAALSLPGPDHLEIATVLVQCRLRESHERQAFVEQIKKQILSVTGVQCRIELVPPRSLPRTSSGKLSRSKARQQFLAGSLIALAY